jgi:hypothetical protein
MKYYLLLLSISLLICLQNHADSTCIHNQFTTGTGFLNIKTNPRSSNSPRTTQAKVPNTTPCETTSQQMAW